MSAPDYPGILTAIESLADIGDIDDFAPRVLSELSALVPNDSISLNEVDPPAGRVRYHTRPVDLPLPPRGAEVWAAFADQHPLIRQLEQTGDGSARKISDVCTPALWHENVLYQRFYRPMGVEHQMSITLPAPRPTILAVALNRATDDFTERDRTTLNVIRPHLAHRWRVVRDLAMTTRLFAATSSVLTEVGTRALALEGNRLVELTPGAADLLDRYLPSTTDGLPERISRWLADLGSAPKSVTRAPPLPLIVELARARLVIRHLPGTSDHPAVLMLTEQDPNVAAQSLRSLGLSPREAEVLGELTTGATNAEIGAALELSPASIKRYLDSVYLKLGVRGRVQAVATALDIVAHHQPPRA